MLFAEAGRLAHHTSMAPKLATPVRAPSRTVATVSARPASSPTSPTQAHNEDRYRLASAWLTCHHQLDAELLRSSHAERDFFFDRYVSELADRRAPYEDCTKSFIYEAESGYGRTSYRYAIERCLSTQAQPAALPIAITEIAYGPVNALATTKRIISEFVKAIIVSLLVHVVESRTRNTHSYDKASKLAGWLDTYLGEDRPNLRLLLESQADRNGTTQLFRQFARLSPDAQPNVGSSCRHVISELAKVKAEAVDTITAFTVEALRKLLTEISENFGYQLFVIQLDDNRMAQLTPRQYSALSRVLWQTAKRASKRARVEVQIYTRPDSSQHPLHKTAFPPSVRRTRPTHEKRKAVELLRIMLANRIAQVKLGVNDPVLLAILERGLKRAQALVPDNVKAPPAKLFELLWSELITATAELAPIQKSTAQRTKGSHGVQTVTVVRKKQIA